MKLQEVKLDFIRLRAEGNSLASICKKLDICKATAQSWEKELEEEIATSRAEELDALYTTFSMKKKARIERLGKTLKRIDEALDSVDLTQVPPDKLLKMKLDYAEALKAEYVVPAETASSFQAENKVEFINEMLLNLLRRVSEGEVTEAQISRETAVITAILKASDSLETAEKVKELENLLGIRKAG